MKNIQREIKASLGTGPMAETLEKVLTELILKASKKKTMSLRNALPSQAEILKK